MKLEKMKINGKWQKVNGKFIESIGHFAYDGCHKIYILESLSEVKTAMEYGYYLYPIEKLRQTYEKSCPLKFIEKFNLSGYYVKQCQKAKWSEVKIPEEKIKKIIKKGL